MKSFKTANIILMVILILCGCAKQTKTAGEYFMDLNKNIQNKDIEAVKKQLGVSPKNNLDYEKQWALHGAIISGDIETIKKCLEAGANPDYISTAYWASRNPLWDVLFNPREEIPIEIMKLIIDYGADVKLRPYIWHVLDMHILTEEDIAWLQENEHRVIGGATTVDIMYKKIEILIKAGADVDHKGAPNRMLFPPTDSNYRHYFKREGSRPINYAIEKNLPVIVDLLSQYTKLDKESLNAAKCSEDPLMIEKINEMWERQRLKLPRK